MAANTHDRAAIDAAMLQEGTQRCSLETGFDAAAAPSVFPRSIHKPTFSRMQSETTLRRQPRPKCEVQ
jgi:hypothetical protein